MKNVPHFWEGPKLFFGFQKRGVGGSARLLARCSARNPGGGLLYLSSFAMRWTVPVPIPSDLAIFKIPTAGGSARFDKLGTNKWPHEKRQRPAFQLGFEATQ